MRLVVLLVFLSLPATASAARTKVAVTEVKSVQGVATGTATILSDIIVSEVARQGYDVISQSDISAMVGFEKQKKMLVSGESVACGDGLYCLRPGGATTGTCQPTVAANAQCPTYVECGQSAFSFVRTQCQTLPGETIPRCVPPCSPP